MTGAAFAGGFANAPAQAAVTFRAALDAMARPGRIRRVSGATPPPPLSPAAGALLLTLCDAETKLHLAGAFDCASVRGWVTFHINAPLVGRSAANFALGNWASLAPLSDYAIGDPDYPDRSCTLIVEMDRLSATGARLTGPGIEEAHRLSLPEIEAFRANRALFPQGRDFFFTAGDRLAALPRSTLVEAA